MNMAETINAPTLRRWTNLLQGLGLFSMLKPEDELVVAILDGRDADAIADCGRRAESAQADVDTFAARYPKLAHRREQLRRRNRHDYEYWLDLVSDPDDRAWRERGRYHTPPASIEELKELAWYEGETGPREELVYAWRRAVQSASEFNVVPDDDSDD